MAGIGIFVFGCIAEVNTTGKGPEEFSGIKAKQKILG